MIEITKKTDCCGCTACYATCPVSAISMAPDEEGFLYPRVDADACIGCGRCERVCPITHRPDPKTDAIASSYVIRVRDQEALERSTSGGFTSPLIGWAESNEGVVCAATFDENFKVCHRLFADGGAASQSRGSKYVQSDMGDCFKQVRGYLSSGKTVCFIGTPCQVAGLKTFLGKDYEDLVTVDLVCHGTPSPKLWDKYLEYQRHERGSDITDISFRNKTYGYHAGTMMIRFASGNTYYGSARVDYMLKSFFSEIASRPICYGCPFKTLDRASDFTIYDCWHSTDLVDGLVDDDKGYTNLIVHTLRGMDILCALADKYELYSADTDKAIRLDGVMALNSATPHPRRSEFYNNLESETLPQHIQRFIPVTQMDRLIEASKSVIYRLGVYRFLSLARDKAKRVNAHR